MVTASSQIRSLSDHNSRNIHATNAAELAHDGGSPVEITCRLDLPSEDRIATGKLDGERTSTQSGGGLCAQILLFVGNPPDRSRRSHRRPHEQQPRNGSWKTAPTLTQTRFSPRPDSRPVARFRSAGRDLRMDKRAPGRGAHCTHDPARQLHDRRRGLAPDQGRRHDPPTG